ncbi:uncharacterized protein LOC144109684 [Amblyomma americanum]
MSRLGRIDEYDPKVQNFDPYLERFEHFVSANEVSEAKKLSVFLTVLGAEAYEVLKNLVVPALPGEKTFAEIKILPKNHYSPQTSVIAERCRFNRRVQLEQESVEDFVLELKHLARKCNFGNILQDALRDRLVAGIRNEETQRALFTTEGLTFQGACKIALDRELATQQAAFLQQRGRKAVEKELSDLEKKGVIERVTQSEWATPLVVVPKKEGDKLRLCGDFKITPNPVLKTDHYPLPLPEDLFTAVSSLSQQASLPSEQPRESPGSAGPTVETTCPEETSSAGTNAPASPPSPAADSTVPLDASGESRESSLPANDDAVVPPRRSQRMRRPPDWFRPSDFKK